MDAQVSLTAAAEDRLRRLGLLDRARALAPPPWLAPGDLVAVEDAGGTLHHLRVARRTLVLRADGQARAVLLLGLAPGAPR
jgi:hypothetical protein